MKNRRIKGQGKLWRTERKKGQDSYEEQEDKRALRAMNDRRIKGQGELWRTEEWKSIECYVEQKNKRDKIAM